MSRTSRNTLMIGGALILIALLLFCGPLTGRFGGGGPKIDEAPSVAAGPPEGANDVTDAAAVGALVGGASGADAGAAGLEPSSADDELPPVVASAVADSGAPLVVAGPVVVAEDLGESADSVADGIGGGSGLPPVSAGPPPAIPVASALELVELDDGANDPVVASRAFDDSMQDLGGIGPAGNRFAPPVAAPGESSLAFAQIDGQGRDGVLRPCDSPGSGCRNLSRAAGPKRLPNPGLNRGGRRSRVP